MKSIRSSILMLLSFAFALLCTACTAPQGKNAALSHLAFWEEMQADWAGVHGERLELFFGKDGTSGLIHVQPTYGSGQCIEITGYRFTDDGFEPVPIESAFPNEDTPADLDPIIEYTWLDIDGDHVVELLVKHRFWGEFHAGGLGFGYEALQYDPATLSFAVVRSEYIPAAVGDNYPSLVEIFS